MVCIVHGVTKSQIQLSNFQLTKKNKKKKQKKRLLESGAEQGPHSVINSFLLCRLLPAFFLAMYLLKKQLICPIEYPTCLDFADCRFNMSFQSLYFQVQDHPPCSVGVRAPIPCTVVILCNFKVSPPYLWSCIHRLVPLQIVYLGRTYSLEKTCVYVDLPSSDLCGQL